MQKKTIEQYVYYAVHMDFEFVQQTPVIKSTDIFAGP